MLRAIVRLDPRSLSDDLDEDALLSPAVELAVEDLLPRTEVEHAVRDGDDDLAAHDLSFEVGISIVLSGPIVAILTHRFVRCEPLQPNLVVVVEPWFIIVDEDRCCYVHGVHHANIVHLFLLSSTV